MQLRLRLAFTLLVALTCLPAWTYRSKASPQYRSSNSQCDQGYCWPRKEAWNRGDLVAFTQTYKDSPDTLFITSTINRGFSGLLEEYQHNYPNRAAMGSLAFSRLEVHPLDDRVRCCHRTLQP